MVVAWARCAQWALPAQSLMIQVAKKASVLKRRNTKQRMDPGVAAQAGQPISFWRFTRYGIVTTLVTTVIAWGYVWLRYFVVAA